MLEEVLAALANDFRPLVAFPEDGPFVEDIRQRGFETLLIPLGRYRSGRKSLTEIALFPWRSARSARLLTRTVRQRGVKLIYINGPRGLWAGALAGRLTGVPTLFHLHLTLTRRFDRLAAQLAARHVTRVVACSQAAAGAFHQGDPALGAELEVIYNPARTWPSAPPPEWPQVTVQQEVVHHQCADRPGSSSPPQGPVIGVVGRITPAKGQHVMVEAAGQLVRHGLSPRVVFVGATDPHHRDDEAYLRSLRATARTLGVEPNLWWAGYQENPGPFYKAFDVLVIPSVGEEGMPMAALEAFECGVPVIGSDVPGIAEIVRDGHNGFLVPPGDDSFLADRLEQVLSNPRLHSDLRAGALATVDSRFSPAGFGATIRRVVRELCASAVVRTSKSVLRRGARPKLTVRARRS